jgi:hypothetical protein
VATAARNLAPALAWALAFAPGFGDVGLVGFMSVGSGNGSIFRKEWANRTGVRKPLISIDFALKAT